MQHIQRVWPFLFSGYESAINVPLQKFCVLALLHFHGYMANITVENTPYQYVKAADKSLLLNYHIVLSCILSVSVLFCYY